MPVCFLSIRLRCCGYSCLLCRSGPFSPGRWSRYHLKTILSFPFFLISAPFSDGNHYPIVPAFGWWAWDFVRRPWWSIPHGVEARDRWFSQSCRAPCSAQHHGGLYEGKRLLTASTFPPSSPATTNACTNATCLLPRKTRITAGTPCLPCRIWPQCASLASVNLYFRCCKEVRRYARWQWLVWIS